MGHTRDLGAARVIDADSVRLDSWLWAARFFKTRSLAAAAIDGGRVEINGEKSKRSKALRVGDTVQLRQGPYHFVLGVTGLAERRGTAAQATLLYRETDNSKAARQLVADRLRLQNPIFYQGAGRPTKQQRRAIDKWKGKD